MQVADADKLTPTSVDGFFEVRASSSRSCSRSRSPTSSAKWTRCWWTCRSGGGRATCASVVDNASPYLSDSSCSSTTSSTTRPERTAGDQAALKRVLATSTTRSTRRWARCTSGRVPARVQERMEALVANLGEALKARSEPGVDERRNQGKALEKQAAFTARSATPTSGATGPALRPAATATWTT